jgi:hypothetical protein
VRDPAGNVLTRDHAWTFTTGKSPLLLYEITAGAEEHGGISPSGTIAVQRDDDATFTITPDEGYRIDDVTVDGSSVGAVSSYTFGSVTSDHTIRAIFKPNTFTIEASVGKDGSISPSGRVSVPYGEDQTFIFMPKEGHVIKDVRVDGESIGPLDFYTFMDVMANHSIRAYFEDVGD